jgi:glutamyl-tRNA reductase
MSLVRLALIHRNPGAAPPPADSTAWRTCLREVHFLPGHRIPFETGVLTDADAYALLLEIVCGLRSPLIGETEVQAQFKEFLASAAARDNRWLKRVGQRVLGDAKRIRHKHLQGFGAHSYGRLAARYLTGARVAVIGTGALASEVVRVAPADALIDVWGRSSERVLPTRPAGLSFSLLADAGTQEASRLEPTSLVVAAPVGAHDLGRVIGCYKQLTNIVDMRSSDQQTVIDGSIPVILLGDLLTDAARTEVGGAPRVRAARADIRNLAADFAGREQLRPFGWDDVCA